MKIALCISGQPRNFERGAEFIKKNLIDINTLDIFIHCWHDSTKVEEIMIGPSNVPASTPIPQNAETVIRECYSPLRAVFEKQINFNDQAETISVNIYPCIVPFNTFSSKYSVWAANQLKVEQEKKQGYQYDCVIRIRFDWGITTPILVEDLKLNPIAVYMPPDCPHGGGWNDQFALGTSKSMDVYASCYESLKEYYDAGVAWCDEILLGHHLHQNGITTLGIRVGYYLLRGAYDQPGMAV